MKHFMVDEVDFNNLGWATPVSRNIQVDSADFGSRGREFGIGLGEDAGVVVADISPEQAKYAYEAAHALADSLQSQLDLLMTSVNPDPAMIASLQNQIKIQREVASANDTIADKIYGAAQESIPYIIPIAAAVIFYLWWRKR